MYRGETSNEEICIDTINDVAHGFNSGMRCEPCTEAFR